MAMLGIIKKCKYFPWSPTALSVIDLWNSEKCS